jgi:ADP-dependent NAD(P)H-hydrate dehydratase
MHPSPPAEQRLDAELLRSWPLPDDEESDKLGRGTVVIIGGSAGTPGAVLLAGAAALRSGAGRLELVTAAEVAPAVAVAMPEALVVAFEAEEVGTLVARADAVAVGPGMRDPAAATRILELVGRRARPDVPVIVDAYALRALDAAASMARRGNVVMTPNRSELQRLLGDDVEDPERQAASRFGATVACFGRVAVPDGSSYFDAETVRGLGTSGAGDVLAGLVAGLAARTGDGPQAAAWASLVHRLAADRLSHRIGPVGYLARELVDEVPAILRELADNG